MGIRHLAPELILQIAEASVNDFDHDSFHYKARPDDEREHLRNLAATNRVLCHFARSRIFKMQYLCLHHDAIRKATEILARPHIASHVKMLGFYLPMREWTKDGELRCSYMCCSTNHFEGMREPFEIKQEMKAGLWIGRISVNIIRLLNACSPTLQHLEINSESWWKGTHDNTLYACLAEILRTYEFPKLDRLVLETDNFCKKVRFWDLSNANELFRKSIGKITDLTIKEGERSNSDEWVADGQQDINMLEEFVAEFGTLQKVFLRGILPKCALKRYEPYGYLVASLQGHPIQSLRIERSTLRGSMSALLLSLRHTLRELILRDVWLVPEEDTWCGVFMNLFATFPETVVLCKLSYNGGDIAYALEGIATRVLKSPRADDKKARDIWQKVVSVAGNITEDEDEGSLEWRKCPIKCTPGVERMLVRLARLMTNNPG